LKTVRERYSIVSIIYDALQKTQQTREQQREEDGQAPSAEVEAAAPDVTSAPRKPRNLKWLKIAIPASVLVLLLVATVKYWPLLKAHYAPPPPVVIKVAPPKPPSIAEAYKRTHVLNGVFLSRREVVAMINNTLVHVGDKIDGLTIIAIGTHWVKLKNEYETVILKASG
jgi:hypothetical protein